MRALGGAQEVQWAQAPLRGPKLQVLYMSRNCPPIDEDPRREVGYLGDMLSTAGGCELSTTHVKTA